MAEYWKSLPRKFCDVCKCWFADNKASIDFHERGKRHQENAQKRIQDIQKRGIKEFKKQQELENEMEKIEKAALAAYEKDLQNMQGGDKSQSDVQIPKKCSNNSSEFNVNLNSQSNAQKAKKNYKCTSDFNIKPKKSVNNVQKKQEVLVKSTPDVEPTPLKVWYEGMSEEGYKYYWNVETQESRWEPPEEGYISIEEQSQENTEAVPEEQQEKSPEGTKSTVEKEEISEDAPCSIGPQPKFDPYGQWVTVEKPEPVEYDLQLPTPSENAVEVVVPIHSDRPSLKFKEKVIGQLTDVDPGEVTFKKRKFTGSSKKNARQRTTDDD